MSIAAALEILKAIVQDNTLLDSIDDFSFQFSMLSQVNPNVHMSLLFLPAIAAFSAPPNLLVLLTLLGRDADSTWIIAQHYSVIHMNTQASDLHAISC